MKPRKAVAATVNLTPIYRSYYDPPATRPMTGDDLDFYEMTRSYWRETDIVPAAVGWYPMEGRALLVIPENADRRHLASCIRTNTWACRNGRKIRVDVLASEPT